MRFDNNVRHSEDSYYGQVRTDVVNYLGDKIPAPDRIVDFGCGSGATLDLLGSMYSLPASSLYGFDLIPHKATKIKVVQHDLTKELPGEIKSLSGSRLFLLLDVLEHLTDPSDILSRLAKEFGPGDSLVVSVPNVRCISVTAPLILLDKFQYTTEGILDSSHFRFFTKTSMEDLLSESGFRVINSEYKAPSFGKLKIIDMFSFGLLRGVTARQTFFLCGV
jgi:trans-aconitate methyltransferase